MNKDNIKLGQTREGFGKALTELGEENEDIVALCADLTESVRMNYFAEKFPDRFVQVGIAEQNMMGIAAGLALSGKTPFIGSYACFSPARNWDQLRVSVCYSNANVKIIGGHAGLSTGADGATHQAMEDIAITRVLPNMTVLVPCDEEEARKATIAASKINGPVYIRLSRIKSSNITSESSVFKVGKANIIKEGKDVTIVTNGMMVWNTIEAANKLESEGISVEIINMHTVKPFDTETVSKSLEKTKKLITYEEHQVHGGLGSATLENLFGGINQNLYSPAEFSIKMIGVNDTFGESGQPEELWEKYGISQSHLIEVVKTML